MDSSCLFFLCLCVLSQCTSNQGAVVQMCDSENSQNSMIYCSGRILDAVNYHSHIFNDSKTFVDMPLKGEPAETLRAFNEQFPPEKGIEHIDEGKLRRFLTDYFNPAGTELVPCNPADWQAHPKKIMRIIDPHYRAWALHLHGIWKQLCKEVNESVLANPQRYSLIYVPHRFIAPGGRFREYYYWDSFWTIRGLLVSGMHETAKHMILNMAYMVDRYGFVPNGGRVYYLRRSQPPFLTPMVYEYFAATSDKAFLHDILPSLQREFDFWLHNRTTEAFVDGRTYTVFQYHTRSNVPRPESYREDVSLAEPLAETGVRSRLVVSDGVVADRRRLWTELASAAESGWDFSSRWFVDKHNLSSINVTNVAPVDLNALLCWNMDILQYLYEVDGNAKKRDEMERRRQQMRKTMKAVFYNETAGAWFDVALDSAAHNTDFLASGALPLFTGCYQLLAVNTPERYARHIHKAGALAFPGGVPTSLRRTGQQWDFPNGWPPLNHMLIEGLRKARHPRMQEEAFRLAKRWIEGNYAVYRQTTHMFEKYDVTEETAVPGGGGEYQVQKGFGWTNGVILELLLTYNERLHAPSDAASLRPPLALLLVACVVAVCRNLSAANCT